MISNELASAEPMTAAACARALALGPSLAQALQEIDDFLPCATPTAWLHWALQHQDLLLIDHANCEKKAAATAMNLLYRHVDRSELLFRMSRLAREELLHFEQVVSIMTARGIAYEHLSASRYAAGLRAHIRQPQRGGQDVVLVDTLIVGAIVEARSCERFARLAPLLDEELSRFYRNLLRSEARHFQDYLALAAQYADTDITPQVQRFLVVEQQLIEEADTEFRFHSGVPAAA